VFFNLALEEGFLVARGIGLKRLGGTVQENAILEILAQALHLEIDFVGLVVSGNVMEQGTEEEVVLLDRLRRASLIGISEENVPEPETPLVYPFQAVLPDLEPAAICVLLKADDILEELEPILVGLFLVPFQYRVHIVADDLKYVDAAFSPQIELAGYGILVNILPSRCGLELIGRALDGLDQEFGIGDAGYGLA